MIVGTAGHVDHGKTALVRALTGVDTDRLKEEKARGITTDLGFAYLPGPDATPIGFVDVPGHESLVRTMVAGAAGIDYALLVVAADEGVKPQTREHIEILRLLGLERGIVLLSKADRADETRRAEVVGEVQAALGASPLLAEPPLFVSVVSGEGIDALQAHLAQAARTARPTRTDGPFRLAVDRAFTLKGVGTIVAGTALSGRIARDETVTLLPARRTARVRTLHVQNQDAAAGQAGERCALALVGITRDEVARGDWITTEPEPHETMRLDVELSLVDSAPRALAQWVPVHFHCGASDVTARVTVLGPQALAPGEDGLAQVQLATALPLRHGDRFVLRDTSARRTIGGGRVLDPRAPARRRQTPERLARLAAMRPRDPDAALAALLALPPHVEDLAIFEADRGLTPAHTAAIVAAHDLALVTAPAARFAMAAATRQAVEETILARLAALHAESPELPGLALDRLRTQLASPPARPLLAALCDGLVADGRLARRGPWFHLPDHVAQLGEEDRRIADVALPLLEQDRFRPPRVRDIAGAIGFHETRVRRACKALVRTGALIEVAHDHFFPRATVLEMAAIARRLGEAADGGRFTAAAFRDALDNGRKVAIQILEFFDRNGLTHRTGDLRRVVKAPEAIFGAPERPT